MENKFQDDSSEVFDDPSSCPDEDRSWKRRHKNDDSRDNNSSRNSSRDRRHVRERLGKLDSKGNHFITNKPRYNH